MRSGTWIYALAAGCAAATSGCGSSTGSGSAGGSGNCSGATPVLLSVRNYEAWCSVSVAGGAASSAAEQTVCVASGSVALAATALSSFQLGDWHGTSGDTGNGDPGTVTGSGPSAQSAATVNVTSGSACVWVCCPFTGGSGCPPGNQCP